jgi:tRNA A37 methylthiotransferase MiaB
MPTVYIETYGCQITGCMAEHLRDELREQAPRVDLVVAPDIMFDDSERI